MSILLTRLLERAELTFREGDAREAETLCYQVIRGATALKNIPLTIDAARLLGRIPITGNVDRTNAFVAIFNHITTLQRNADPSDGLALCDLLIEVLETGGDPVLRRKALEVGVFISGSRGGDRKKYLEGLAKSLGTAAGAGQGRAVPECTIAEGPAVASDVLTVRGCVLIRNLLDAAVLEKIRGDADLLFVKEARQAVPLREVPNYDRIISPEANSFLTAVLAPFMTGTPALQPELCYVRQVASSMPETKVPFHQDMNAFGRILVNVWAPLMQCGVTAPGLELVAERVDEIADTVPAKNQYDDLQISQDLIAERYGLDALFRPEMNPGDIVILLGTTIHRTHITPAMQERRTSLELRFG